jgi:hypothetical protein
MPHPLSLGQGHCSVSSLPPLSVCYMVHCLFFNFAGQFDFGCYSLAQEITFVICYLPCFREWLITWLLSTFLPFQCLFTDSSAEISSFPLPLSLVHFQCSHPFCCMLDYSSWFIVQFFVWGCQSAQGVFWFILGVPGAIPHDAWSSPFWSAKCLAGRLEPAMVVVVAVVAAATVVVASHRFSHQCFISSKCGSSVSLRFWSHGAHAVCFCILVAILDPLISKFWRYNLLYHWFSILTVNVKAHQEALRKYWSLVTSWHLTWDKQLITMCSQEWESLLKIRSWQCFLWETI